MPDPMPARMSPEGTIPGYRLGRTEPHRPDKPYVWRAAERMTDEHAAEVRAFELADPADERRGRPREDGRCPGCRRLSGCQCPRALPVRPRGAAR